MKLSVIIPCFNERETLKDLLDAVKNCGVSDLEILVIDDFSTDGTRELLNKFQDIVIAFHNKNLGKGAALRTGFKVATGDMCIVQAGDRQVCSPVCGQPRVAILQSLHW